MAASFDSAWLTFSKGKPVGLLFGQAAGEHMFVGQATWFAATKREILEAVVNMANEFRKEPYPVLWWAKTDVEKEMSLYIAKHGVARRVGTIEAGGKRYPQYQVKQICRVS